MRVLRIGTRGSHLALYQANTVAALLEDRAKVPGEIVIIKTSGDRLAEAPLAQIGGKRLFVKEIEDALLSGYVDVAVHSSKDMPVVLPEGLEIAAVLAREDPRDALVVVGESSPTTFDVAVRRLGDAPRIGTGSVRRIAQLRRTIPGARFLPVRGNLDTRLRKLDAGDFDGIVLAAAGLRRLGLESRISASIAPADCVPAPGQGVIAIEARSEDEGTRALVAQLNDARAWAELLAERAVVRRLGGGCQMPLGAHAHGEGGTLHLDAIVSSLDGLRVARAEATGAIEDADLLGLRVADLLHARGAAAILAEVEQQHVIAAPPQP